MEAFRYHGLSMWPLFQEGDVLLLEEATPSSLQPGDCIVFRGSGIEGHVVHRVVSVSPRLRTRGDARPLGTEESPDQSTLVGRVTTRVRYGHATPVPGGVTGRLSAGALRLAARLDPARNSRGGALARLLRFLVRPAARILLARAALVNCQDAQGRPVPCLATGARVLAVRASDGSWTAPWPESLLIDPDKLPPATRNGEKQLGG